MVLGDAHALPFGDAAVDLALFVTTLEFLEHPATALREAVRVSRRGLVVLALNRWSLGGLSRRLGPAARGALLGQARDVSIVSLRALIRTAAGHRLAASDGQARSGRTASGHGAPRSRWATSSGSPHG